MLRVEPTSLAIFLRKCDRHGLVCLRGWISRRAGASLGCAVGKVVDRVDDGNVELTGPARQALKHGWAQWQALDEETAGLDSHFAEHASHDPQGQRCMDVCGAEAMLAYLSR